jgi:16S rRNA (guanine527-N7)-methyltransferase
VSSAELPPDAVHQVFGPNADLAIRYARLLVTDGVERGLIGPRESDRIWTRHVLNCAALAELLPSAARVVDIGSGAGLPGIPLALALPTAQVDLVEPLARRVQFLEEVVAALGLGERVRVVRGRAEEPSVIRQVGDSAWVTARAVAPLDRLVAWCLPLLHTGGKVIAMKGERAAMELDEHGPALRRAGVVATDIVQCGMGVVEPPVTVVVLERGHARSRSKGKS